MKKTLFPVVAALAASVACAADAEPADPAAVVAQVRAAADRRIDAIRRTPNGAVPQGAATYYVSARSGDDSADGRTPQTAWRTSARLGREAIAPGSFVLFERGGTYRGTVKTLPGVTYTAYGEGPKPLVCASPEDGADPRKWRTTDKPGIWAYAIGHRDVGTLVFNGGESCATKVVFRTDRKTGRRSDLKTGRPFDSYRDLEGDLRFWHDYYEKGTGELYLCSERNPGERFRSIEFNVKAHGFGVGGNADVTIDNFEIRYVGVHGVGAGTCRNLTVRNCEFAWIGGSIQAEGIFGRDYPTRLGNAVEIYGGCDGYVVSNCYIRQVYDAAITHQFNIPAAAGAKRYDERNVLYAHNVIEDCNYSVEYFLTAPKGNQSLMENVLVTDNLMFDAGCGFCEQRPDRGVASHVQGWFGKGRNRARNFVIRGNVMCRAIDSLLHVGAGLRNLDGSSSLPEFADNVLIAHEGDRFGFVSETSGKVHPFGGATQAFMDGLGKGNRCVVLPPKGK